VIRHASRSELKQKLDHATRLMKVMRDPAARSVVREKVRELERLIEIAADREDAGGI
jgi:hypothetical protein